MVTIWPESGYFYGRDYKRPMNDYTVVWMALKSFAHFFPDGRRGHANSYTLEVCSGVMNNYNGHQNLESVK